MSIVWKKKRSEPCLARCPPTSREIAAHRTSAVRAGKRFTETPTSIEWGACVASHLLVYCPCSKRKCSTHEESSSFLRLDPRCGCRPGFSCLLHHSRDLSPAHHDASAGFASNDLQREIEGVSQKMLNQTLRKLEKDS